MRKGLLLLLVLLPIVANAHDFEVDGIYYKISGKEVTVTYQGDNIYSSSYTGEVIIPNTVYFDSINYLVSSIGQYAFSFCTGLTKITIPSSITSIDDFSFWGCCNLNNVDIPYSVVSIGNNAFQACENLTNIFVPNSVNLIGKNAFEGTAWYNNHPDGLVYAGSVAYRYKGLISSGTVININEGTVGIASSAFENCTGLVGVKFPNSVTVIGYNAFQSCSDLVSIKIPNSVTTIFSGTFRYCTALTSIEIPNSVTYIANYSFVGCLSLTTLEIPNSVKSISHYVFDGCGLKSVVIGNSVTSIGRDAFQNCEEIEDVYCYSASPPECDDNTFTNYGGTLHVQAASVAAYFTAPCWRNFATILGDAVGPTDLLISQDSAELQLGEQFNLTATIVPSNATSNMIIWNSTNPTIATVENGVVTAIGIGNCDIIATCFGMQVICHINVRDQIKLDYEEVSVLPNHIVSLTPTASLVLPELIVESSDPTIAAARLINGQVQVVGIKEGTAIITVSSIDGSALEATCLVTVYTEPGDLNLDGYLTISDVTSLIDCLLGGGTSGATKNTDVNGDGTVNISDVTSLIDTLLGRYE